LAEKLEKPQEGLPQSAQPEKTYKTSDPRPHHTELDGFRGIAILMTVITHTLGGWFTATSSLYLPLLGVNVVDLLLFGYLAVPMFFLLSGYLLTWTEEGRRRRGSYSILNYAKRRALRIVPAYYLAITVVILVTGLIGVDPPHPSMGLW
jgi:peptidoglycan/LPS O-acetylase OafA/YrhL